MRPGSTSSRCGEEVERRGGVLLPAPAVGVDGALAVAGAARVIDEDAVAVADEHLGVAQGAAAVAAAARDHQHGRAVLRRAVPALELDVVGGREADGLVGGVRRAADRAVQRVDVDDRHADRARRRRPRRAGSRQHEHADRPAPRPGSRRLRRGGGTGIQAARPTSTTPAPSASTPVTSLAVDAPSIDDVVGVAAAVDGREHAEREGGRSAETGPQRAGTGPRRARSRPARSQRPARAG